MKPTQEEILLIKKRFSEMQTTQDLVSLLNFSKPFLYGEKAIPFKLRQITYYCNPKRTNSNWAFFNQYQDFEIPKKSGGVRRIHAPKKGLKAVQRTLAFIFQCVFEPHKAAMGFTKNKSIVDNARLHVNSRYVYNIDLIDFFPSIDQARVWKCLQLDPFNLNKSTSREVEIVNWQNFLFSFPQKVKEVYLKSTQNYKCTFPIKFLSENDLNKSNSVSFKLKVVTSPKSKYVVDTNGIRYRCQIDFTLKKPYNIIQMGDNLEESIFMHLPEEHVSALKINDQNLEHILKVLEDLERLENPKSLNFIIRKPYVRYVLCDIENDYFGPYLKKPNLFRLEIANKIAAICCTEMEVERINENGEIIQIKKNVLPQGAPTSPILTNIVCQKMDHRLSGLAKRFGLLYSRYADDITFSSLHNVYQKDSEFLIELDRIIKDQGFRINPKKTRLQKDGYKKDVTGLLVHGQVNVQKKYIKELRMWLNYWERYGYDKANKMFRTPALGNISVGESLTKFFKTPSLKKVLEGKLNYLRMVKGATNKTYKKLNTRFRVLNPILKYKDDRSIHLNQTLDILINDGLDKALDFYKPI